MKRQSLLRSLAKREYARADRYSDQIREAIKSAPFQSLGRDSFNRHVEDLFNKHSVTLDLADRLDIHSRKK